MVEVQQEAGERPILTVAEINTEIQNALAAAFPAVIWVRGEVQRFPRDASRRKHVYFELHDTSGGGAANFQVSAAIMDWDRRRFGLQRFMDGSDPDLQIQDQLDSLSFAGRLWQLFRAIISGTLNELEETLGCSVDTVMLAIDKRVQEFFIHSLQLDVFTMRLEYE